MKNAERIHTLSSKAIKISQEHIYTQCERDGG